MVDKSSGLVAGENAACVLPQVGGRVVGKVGSDDK